MTTATSAYRLRRTGITPPPPPTLDAQQRAVVAHPGGPLLVLAGPGTGKTTTLVEAVADRVARGMLPEEILVLTFSRKAAGELRDRIATRLRSGGAHAGGALPTATTFHSFCYALVRQHQPPELFTYPLRLMSGPEQDVFVRELLAGQAEDGTVHWPAELRAALATRGFADEVRAVVARSREIGLDPDALARFAAATGRADWRAAAEFLGEYLNVLDAQGVVDYAELVHRAVILAERPEVAEQLRRRYRAVFVDEYQDTDPAQVRLLQALAGNGRDLVAVGDPDQSIYAFRGADVNGILDFRDRFPDRDGDPARTIVLRTSRRAGAGLLRASREITRRMPLSRLPAADALAHRDLAADRTGDDDPSRVEVYTYPTPGAELDNVADILRRAHLEDGVPWGEMAVLVRSGARSIPAIRRALSVAGVPLEIAGDELPLAAEQAVAPLLTALRVAADPDALDEETARMLLVSPMGGLDSADLRVLGRALRAEERAAAEAGADEEPVEGESEPEDGTATIGEDGGPAAAPDAAAFAGEQADAAGQPDGADEDGAAAAPGDQAQAAAAGARGGGTDLDDDALFPRDFADVQPTPPPDDAPESLRPTASPAADARVRKRSVTAHVGDADTAAAQAGDADGTDGPPSAARGGAAAPGSPGLPRADDPEAAVALRGDVVPSETGLAAAAAPATADLDPTDGPAQAASADAAAPEPASAAPETGAAEGAVRDSGVPTRGADVDSAALTGADPDHVDGPVQQAASAARSDLATAAASATLGAATPETVPAPTPTPTPRLPFVGRSSAELIREALAHPEQLVAVDERVGRGAYRLGRLIEAARAVLDGGGTTEAALWELWQGTPWPARLERSVLRGGAAGRNADRDLDAVVALFEVAARAEERAGHRGALNFLEELTAQQIPGDRLDDAALRGESVRLLTAHRSKGLQWRLVVVAGVQEGLWPDLRRRGSLLEADRIGSDGLAEPLSPGALLAEERRLFYVAATRARERLVVTAVKSAYDDGDQPSRFLAELGEEGVERADVTARPRRPLSTSALVAELRASAVDPKAPRAVQLAAARRLARLAALRDEDGYPLVPAAHPDRWWGLVEPTDPGIPVRDPRVPVRLSGSAVEKVDTCTLNWFLGREVRAESARSAALGFGNVVHALADEVGTGATPAELPVLMERLDRVWDALAFDAPWQSAQQKEEARSALERFLAWHTHERHRVVAATEHEFEVSLTAGDHRIEIRGSMDRVERGEDGLAYVVDFKTGKSKPNADDVAAHPQLAVYQMAVANGALDEVEAFGGARPESGGAELVQLRHRVPGAESAHLPVVQEQVPPEPDEGGRTWVSALLADVAGRILGERFTPKSGSHCDRCDFRKCCSARTEGRSVVE
ncbi:UvrD-helicase domain-containing protein [Uniformispora flossi]|uniref:UvrD-helicase domain-containing protein n=1 Tax=Uniformispora flossi TaxID=3390723 RepID=UPI003C2ECCA1